MMFSIKERILLLKELGLGADNLEFFYKNLDDFFDDSIKRMNKKEGMETSREFIASLFTAFFSKEFPNVFKKKESLFEVLEQADEKEKSAEVMGECYGELIVKFAEKHKFNKRKAGVLKNSIKDIYPIIFQIIGENPGINGLGIN